MKTNNKSQITLYQWNKERWNLLLMQIDCLWEVAVHAQTLKIVKICSEIVVFIAFSALLLLLSLLLL